MVHILLIKELSPFSLPLRSAHRSESLLEVLRLAGRLGHCHSSHRFLIRDASEGNQGRCCFTRGSSDQSISTIFHAFEPRT
jgi:hypothetical protein